MKTEKQKNVFTELQKNKKTRGKGLASPPKLALDSSISFIDENSEAVPQTKTLSRRSYRISTYIYEDSGETLDQLILKIKKLEGKKPKIASVIERSLESLDSELSKTLGEKDD